MPRIVRRHPRLGELVFDPDLTWWNGRVAANAFTNLGARAVDVGVALPEDASEGELDEAARTIAKVNLAAALAKASEELLETYDTGWRHWQEADGTEHEGTARRCSPHGARRRRAGAISRDCTLVLIPSAPFTA